MSVHSTRPAGLHPSSLELDLLAVGCAVSPATEAHVAGCSACAAAVSQVTEAGPLPAALRREVAGSARSRRDAGSRLGWIGAAVAAVAVLAVLALRDTHPAHEDATPVDPGVTTVKGGQAVAVYLKRGTRTLLWDGSRAIEPGDRIQLKVVPDGLAQVEVFTEAEIGGERALVSLYRGPVAPAGETVLPAAWQVDGRGDEEVLVVVMTSAPVSTERARAAAIERERGPDIWVTRLVLGKRGEGRR